MRISTTQMFRQGIESFSAQQVKLSKLQQQISTGVKINKPSDDPAASSRILELQEAVSIQEQYQTNISTAETRLSIQETALDSLGTISHRLKELAVQGNNGTLDATSSRAIGTEVEGILQEIIALGNMRDANGDFLFAGFQNDTQPFTQILTGSLSHVIYNGDDGQRSLQVSETRQMTVDNPGSEVFLQLTSATALNELAAAGNAGTGVMAPARVTDASLYVPGTYEIRFTAPGTYDVFDVTAGANIVTAATYTDSTDINFQGIGTSITGAPAAGDVFTVSQGQYKDIFESVQNFADTMNSNAAPVRRDANMGEFLNDLDTFLNRTLEIRTSIGGRMNNLESQKLSNDADIFIKESTISELRDTDLAEAISQLTLEQTTLDAAQAIFSRITGSSLFNFLR